MPDASASLRGTALPSQPIVLKISDLRSAYLLRAGVVRYDLTRTSPTEIRQQLQQHFNTVLGLLLVATPRSVEIAVQRLEAADGRNWTDEMRSEVRRRLLFNRHIQMQRLATYRDVSLFPQNEGEATEHPVPIFVDRYDTACAVGHLMRQSGWRDAVAKIQSASNLIYVPDALYSAVSSWTLTSGLTLEEAALIQPGYLFPAPYLVNDYEPGELSLNNNGLKYENFHIEAHSYQNTTGQPFHTVLDNCGGGLSGCPLLTPVADNPHLANTGFNAGTGILFGVPGDDFDPFGTHWITIGGAVYSGGYPDLGSDLRSLDGHANFEIRQLIIQFDVSTLSPDMFLDGIAEYSYPTYGGFGPLFGSTQYEMTTVATSPPFGMVHFEDQPAGQPFEPKSDSTALLSKLNHVKVTTTVWLNSGASLDGYAIGLRVVAPEPHPAILMLAGIVCMVVFWSRVPWPSRARI